METNKTQSFSGNPTSPPPPEDNPSNQHNGESIQENNMVNSNEEVNDRSGEIVEKFKLLQLIGEGGMGQVYLGQHSFTDRKVAIKILHQEYANNEEILTRIKREAKAAALIGHPNIVEIIDSGTDQFGAPFIAMELLKGTSLERVSIILCLLWGYKSSTVF
ncbi:MAG: protein kinase domain-containing protein [Myxococcota bacterium]